MKHRPKILVVDRDENILSAFGNYLRKKNYSMVGVNNIKTGMKLINQHEIKIMITDVRVNSEFGVNFISQAKNVQSNLQIIAITSYPDKINEPYLKPYGVNYVFVKPLELSKLDEAINNCLHNLEIN